MYRLIEVIERTKETLLTTDPSEQARQDRAREEERLRLEARVPRSR